jgi:hypothetical protein
MVFSCPSVYSNADYPSSLLIRAFCHLVILFPLQFPKAQAMATTQAKIPAA